MTRRRFIALVSVCVLAVLGVVAVGTIAVVTRSESGQAGLRRWIERRVAANIDGRIHIGRIGGNLLTGVTIDSLELRDDEDSLFVATGRIELQYDPRDLVDRRLWFRRVTVHHPQVVARQHENWTWNFKRLFRVGKGPDRPSGPERGFGDFVIADSVRILGGGSFRLTIPWHPDDSLRGARRDSAVRANLERTNAEIRRTSEGLTQTYRWTNGYAFIRHARIADPDSAGKLFVIDTLHADETVPPFKWRNVAGRAFVLGDSVWVTASHWDLPGSTGRGEGKIVWGSDLPVRYAVTVTGDSVSLSDLSWVYPTLPRTGGGSMVLTIRNERDLRRLDYAVTAMDVRTTGSRLRGGMTFETGGPVLSVHDVDLVADPVDFDLLRTLNGGPFPADWQGKLTGTVKARGGPVNRFRVDAADLVFRDANVPGAVSRVQGSGELDILYPALTAFRGFRARSPGFDLRTLVAIYPSFPAITGTVSGEAVLDSSWLDVRLRDARLVHTDGPDDPSRFTGGGRITYGDQFLAYDLSLNAEPVSFTTLARSYPNLVLRGTMSGPIRVRGIAPDLDVEADLTGAAGRLTYVGKADADSVGGLGGRGAGTFAGLELARLLGYDKPGSTLVGRYEIDVSGDSVATLAGPFTVRFDRSVVDGLQIDRGLARGRFDLGVVRLDSLSLDGPPGRLVASGALGVTRSAGHDSLAFALDVDSLGGLRRYLQRSAAGAALGVSTAGPSLLDSLGGAVQLRGTARGSVDTLDLRAAVFGRNVAVRGDRARSVRGSLGLRTAGERATGSLELRADTVLAAGLRLASVRFAGTLLDRDRARFSAGASGDDGLALRTGGEWGRAGAVTVTRLDTLDLAFGDARWSLETPSRVTRSPAGVSLDTLALRDAGDARIAGSATVPATGEARGLFVADGVALADPGRLAGLPSALEGRLGLRLTVGGTRERPLLSLGGAARGVRYGGLTAEDVRIDARYEAERAELRLDLQRGGRSVLDAALSYPVALTLFSARVTEDSLRGHVRADSVDLSLVEALTPKLRNATGRLALDLAVSGRASRPHLGGRAVVSAGAVDVPDAGIRIAGIEGVMHVDPRRDSLTVDELRWITPASGGSGALQGSLVFRDLDNPRLDLRLQTRGMRAVDRRNLARLDVSTGPGGLTLVGTPASAVLSGAVQVDRGTIFIPELVRKQLEELTLDDFAQLFDTTDVRNRSLMPQPPSALVENLRLDGVSVLLGDEVWLRSREASIKLGGTLNVTRALDESETTRSSLARTGRSDAERYKLALAGTLTADRGTYTLDLTAVQREFQVESGRITFFGTPDFNPEIDVTALYRVKQASRSDIGIRARISGPFYPQPSLELSSTDAALAPSDLVSYLVTGRPSYDLNDQNLAAAQRALEFVLPTAGAYLSRTLRDQLGGFVDLFQIQSGAVNDQSATAGAAGSQFRSFLSSTRLGGEKQISDRLFLSFSTGLSAFCDDASQQGILNSIEGKFEYRFPLPAPERLAFRVGLDPSASALRCGRSVRGFAPTPQQVGFSLFRSWSF